MTLNYFQIKGRKKERKKSIERVTLQNSFQDQSIYKYNHE
jgi:hypothetical protein